MTRTLISTWAGAYLVDNGVVLRSLPFPTDHEALTERLTQRRGGRLAPEEEKLVADPASRPSLTTDRRFLGEGITLARGPLAWPAAITQPSTELHRELLLDDAQRSLRLAWDPSVHVEEAVRAMADLDHIVNLLGERLASWSSKDAPASAEGADASVAQLVERMLAQGAESDPDLPPPDPDLIAARQRIAEAFRTSTTARGDLESAIERAMPRRAPNLSALLGPLLAARLVAQAGGLDRLARLPASTVQVLGAEKAFFEHLRGRAPPPRHGLLFLHPAIQGAPRRSRGKLARALAGKVSIAARLDRQGSAVDPSLSATFAKRKAEIAALPAERRAGRARPARTSRRPLHRATQNR